MLFWRIEWTLLIFTVLYRFLIGFAEFYWILWAFLIGSARWTMFSQDFPGRNPSSAVKKSTTTVELFWLIPELDWFHPFRSRFQTKKYPEWKVSANICEREKRRWGYCKETVGIVDCQGKQSDPCSFFLPAFFLISPGSNGFFVRSGVHVATLSREGRRLKIDGPPKKKKVTAGSITRSDGRRHEREQNSADRGAAGIENLRGRFIFNRQHR